MHVERVARFTAFSEELCTLHRHLSKVCLFGLIKVVAVITFDMLCV